jgi:hypothetical protein
LNVLQEAYTILPLTPGVLDKLLRPLPDELVRANEGPDTWSPFDIVGHLLHGDKRPWRERITILLEKGESEAFPQFDRFAQFKDSEGKTMGDLLTEFATRRAENVVWLKGLKLQPPDLERKGLHPNLGPVTLGNLLSTWPAHDLTHIAQICRVLAKRYKEPMGPWVEFNRLVKG